MEAPPSFAPVFGYSRTSIDRAGVTLRELLKSRREITDADVLAFGALITFRETFQTPLSKTATGLRSMVCSESPELKVPGGRIPVVQRLKRRAQIMNKLVRMPNTKLSNMGDIGGCRAILRDRDRVDGVVRRIRKNWDVSGKIRDTRDEPAPSGYRAVHVIVVRDGRRIEIQLRTPREHDWALAVERTGARLGIPLKEGQGPADLKQYFRLASVGMYRDEVGPKPDETFLEEFRVAQHAIQHYFDEENGT